MKMRNVLLIFSIFFLFGFYKQINAQSFILTQAKVLQDYNENPCWVSFSSKGNYNVLTQASAEVQLRDKDFNTLWTYKSTSNNPGANDALFTPDEKYLIFTKFQTRGDFVVMQIADKKFIQQVKVTDDYINSISLSPDGKTLVTTSTFDGKINVYNWKNYQFVPAQSLVGALMSKNGYNLGKIEISPDGKFAVTYANGTEDTDTLQIYDLNNGKLTLLQKILQKNIDHFTFHPSGKYFVVGANEGLVTYQLEKGNFNRKRTLADVSYARRISFDKEGKYMATNMSRSIKIFEWNNSSIKELTEVEMHRGWIMDVEFSPDKNYLITTSTDKTSIIWQLPDAPIASSTSKKEAKPDQGEKKGNEKKPVEKNKTESNDVSDFQPSVTGKNYLYIVGINNYKYWNPLSNASKDAKDVKNVLTTRYTFEPANIFEVYNEEATSKNILAKLTEVRQKLSSNDNLLIYFSGHGYYNAEIEEGFWIPVDAKKGQETEYLANSTLLKYIKSIPAKHIFLVADACFSGSLFSQGSRGYVENVEQYKSRWALTSGRLEYVSDGQTGKNSPFASYFIKYLQDNQKKKVPVSELVNYVKSAVGNNSEQQPVGNPLKSVGDEGGEFIFYLK